MWWKPKVAPAFRTTYYPWELRGVLDNRVRKCLAKDICVGRSHERKADPASELSLLPHQAVFHDHKLQAKNTRHMFSWILFVFFRKVSHYNWHISSVRCNFFHNLWTHFLFRVGAYSGEGRALPRSVPFGRTYARREYRDQTLSFLEKSACQQCLEGIPMSH